MAGLMKRFMTLSVLGLAGFLFLMAGCLRTGTTRTIRINNSAAPSDRFYVPVKNVKVLSRFGKRNGSFHTGLDIRGRHGGGDKVYAARSGRVIEIKKGGGYGKMITLKHEDGFRTRYAHLKRYLVKPGQRVKAKEPIGIVGRTGRASSPHLHFEVLTPKGQFMDPAPLLFPK